MVTISMVQYPTTDAFVEEIKDAGKNAIKGILDTIAPTLQDDLLDKSVEHLLEDGADYEIDKLVASIAPYLPTWLASVPNFLKPSLRGLIKSYAEQNLNMTVREALIRGGIKNVPIKGASGHKTPTTTSPNTVPISVVGNKS